MQRVGAWGRASVVGLICLVTACGGEEIPGAATGEPPDGGPGVEPCPAGHVRGRTGQCMPVGIQGCAAQFIDEDGVCRPAMSKCPAGAVPKVDAACVPVGISACAPEFLEDDGLCHPAMAKCPEGTFVVPSEGCVPVDGPAGCGAGTWGNVLEAPGDLHVSAAAPDASGDGSRAKPYKTIAAAMAMAGSGDRVVLAEGVYDEPVTIDKDLELIGVCPSKVRIQGLKTVFGDEQVNIFITDEANAAVRGVQVGGGGTGVLVVYSNDVVLEGVYVNGATGHGVDVAGETSHVSVIKSWIDGTALLQGKSSSGVFVNSRGHLYVEASSITNSSPKGAQVVGTDSGLDIVNSHIEGTNPDANGDNGHGVDCSGGAALTLMNSSVRGNRTAGVIVWNKDAIATVKSSIIEETAERESDAVLGEGVVGMGGEIVVDRTVVSGNRYTGVVAAGPGTKMKLSLSLVTGTKRTSQKSTFGIGMYIYDGASAVVTNSAITLNEGLGVAVVGEGTSLTATSNVIEETQPSSVTGEYGKGIEVSDGAYAELVSNAIRKNMTVGVHLAFPGTEVKATSNLIEGTFSQASDGKLGRGVEVDIAAVLKAEANHINKNHDAGIFTASSDINSLAHVELRGDWISSTLGRESNGEWGAGLYADVASVDIESAVFTENLVAGIMIRMSTADIRDTLIDGVPSGTFTLQNPVETFKDVCDGLLVRDGSTVSISNLEVRNCCRAGLLFQESSGTLAGTRSTENRFGLVLQGMPRPVIEATNEFMNNAEMDQWLDGNLPVPNALPALP